MKKVKNVLFKIEIDGQGVVNYDSSGQRFTWNDLTVGKEQVHKENCNFAKKNWYIGEDGVAYYKIKISSNSLRYNIFKDGMRFSNTNLLSFPEILVSATSTPYMLLRGYLFTEKDKETVKRKSAIEITDAEQICNAISNIETFNVNSEKIDDETKKGNTFFKKESVGKIKYAADGNIDLMQMQFLSFDTMYDRFAMHSDYYELFRSCLSKYIKDLGCKRGYYKIKSSVIDIPEHGVLFSNSDVLFFVKDFFKHLMLLNINKTTAYAKISKIQYKLVYNPLIDKYSDVDGWETIESTEDIDKIDFVAEDFYIEEDEQESLKLRKTMSDVLDGAKKVRKAEQDAKKALEKLVKDAKKKAEKEAGKKSEEEPSSETE